jgi:hypothetical protein
MSAALIRVRNLCEWRSGLLTFEFLKQERRWIISGITAFPSNLKNRIFTSDSCGEVLQRSSTLRIARLPMTIGARPVSVRVQLSGDGSRRFALVSPSEISKVAAQPNSNYGRPIAPG